MRYVEISRLEYSQISRRGVTIVELLTVLAVTGVLLAVLLPAVQQAREVARRAHCLANMRQLGIAMHGYSETYGVLPPGIGVGGKSALVSMLPYLEQTAIYQAFDWSKWARDNVNVTIAMSQRIPLFVCPSDSQLPISGATNYVVNGGTGLHVEGRFEGPFAPIIWIDSRMGGGCVRVSDVTDGTTNTAAISEILIGGGSRDPRRALWDLPTGMGSPMESIKLVKACEEWDTDRSQYFDGWSRGFPWTEGNPPSTMYNHSNVPNSKSCVNAGDVLTSVYSSGSQHFGGANMCLVDGSVRFMSNSIDITVWQAIGTKSRGELIEGF